MSNGIYDYVDDLKKRLSEKDQRIAELQKQLQSHPAEIVENIRKSIHYYPIALLDSDKEPKIKTLGISKEVLDTILKEYQKWKEKIWNLKQNIISVI